MLDVVRKYLARQQNCFCMKTLMTDNIESIRKLLDTLKTSLMEENRMELALRTEALLQFSRKIL